MTSIAGRGRALCALAILLAVSGSTALAQTDGGAQPLDLFAPATKGDFAAPALRKPLDPSLSYAPQSAETEVPVTMKASLVADSPALAAGVTWRIFDARRAQNGEFPLLATASGGSTAFALPRGDYFVHVAFGRAGATKKIRVELEPRTENFVLDAGGLRLSAVVGDGKPLGGDKVSFEIAQEPDEGPRTVIARAVAPEHVLGLNAGIYQVTSRYGEVNAIVRADIEVKAGKLTEVTMRHTGAEVTLKLVEEFGGEALANTSWTVLTTAGDTVHESVGAFPRIILAEGNYTAVARHKQAIYSRDFETEAGIDTDVEVRLADIVRNSQTSAR